MSLNTDFLNMSDEDFAKAAEPTSAPASTGAATAAEPPVETQEPEAPAASEETTDTQETQEGAPVATQEPEPEGGEETDPEPAAVPAKETTPAAAEKKTEEPPATEPEDRAKEKPAENPVDYKAFFERVMAPFKANGKAIQLTSADEVISLMQMGANYTKKMQSIQHHRKYLLMLENNGLLDEQKLSLLIDLDKGDKEAIKKFFKDKNLDPVDVDTSSEVKYKTGSHAISDQEVSLASTIEDVKSMDGGLETLQSVSGWDKASKKIIGENPGLLTNIHAQRKSGVYDRISTEIERRRVLGQLPAEMPFLHAYKMIGDDLANRGVLQGGTRAAPSAPAPVPVRNPVTVRPARTPVTKAPDSSKVRAAAATRTAPKPVSTPINVLAMSDDDFLKMKPKV